MKDQIIEAGGHKYMCNAKGNLVPLENVRDIDIERDNLVRDLVAHAIAINELLADFKQRALGDIQSFAELSAERYGAKLGGSKGNITLRTFDGSLSICRDMADKIEFDEGIKAAEDLIGECLAEWTKDSRPEIRAIIGRAFKTDKQGNLNTASILALQRLEIADHRWKLAMKAITESITIAETRAYIRIYRRDEKKDTLIPLDLASA